MCYIFLLSSRTLRSRFRLSPDVLRSISTGTCLTLRSLTRLSAVTRRKVRLLSTISDYLLLLVTALPFVTGYFLTRHVLEPRGLTLAVERAHFIAALTRALPSVA